MEGVIDSFDVNKKEGKQSLIQKKGGGHTVPFLAIRGHSVV